jgi:hypothetical protein
MLTCLEVVRSLARRRQLWPTGAVLDSSPEHHATHVEKSASINTALKRQDPGRVFDRDPGLRAWREREGERTELASGPEDCR